MGDQSRLSPLARFRQMAAHTRDQADFRRHWKHHYTIACQRFRSRKEVIRSNTSMPSSCCCVPGCSSRGGLSFPTDETLRKKWILAVRRVDDSNKSKLWEPSPHSIVCHAHFKPSDFHFVNRFGKAPLRKQRRKDAVPSIFPWTNAEQSDERRVRLEARQHRKRPFQVITDNVTECSEETIPDMIIEVVIEEESGLTTDSSETSEEIVPKLTEKKTCTTQTPSLPMFTIDKIADNNEAILFYTGLACYKDFKFALASLGEAVNHLNYLYSPVTSISIEDQFLITLMKLRQNKTNYELGFLFNTSDTTIANIWITWVNFMHWQWSEIPCWPERDLVRFFCPSDFKSKFPNTRIIIDGTEMPIMKPKPPVGQQSTYSTYKNKNTVKVLVGCTPGGLVSYLSPAYGGSSSDRQIVERSALTVLCDRGDSIMADKGFNVQDMFALKDVSINLPTFFSRKNRMSTQTVMKDRKISSKRVHIERIIGLAKTFKILTSPLNSTETKLATEITSVCFMLCKFKKCIVPVTS